MLITARESVCCLLLKLALSVSSQPNIILTREMSGCGGTNFPVWPNYNSSQPPDFFLPLSNIVKIYYKTGLRLANHPHYLVNAKVKEIILAFLEGKFEVSNWFQFKGKITDIDEWLSSLKINTVARESIIVDLLLRGTRSFYVEKTSNFGCLPSLQYL